MKFLNIDLQKQNEEEKNVRVFNFLIDNCQDIKRVQRDSNPQPFNS